jgi:hypothetical protein
MRPGPTPIARRIANKGAAAPAADAAVEAGSPTPSTPRTSTRLPLSTANRPNHSVKLNLLRSWSQLRNPPAMCFSCPANRLAKYRRPEPETRTRGGYSEPHALPSHPWKRAPRPRKNLRLRQNRQPWSRPLSPPPRRTWYRNVLKPAPFRPQRICPPATSRKPSPHFRNRPM